MPFISSSCLIVAAGTSSTMLDKSGERHPCLVSNLKGKLLPFEDDAGCGFVICGLYYIGVYTLYAHFAESFYHKWVLDFIECFFCIY